MFRYNGFTITILQDHVEASQAGVVFKFATLEQAIDTLNELS